MIEVRFGDLATAKQAAHGLEAVGTVELVNEGTVALGVSDSGPALFETVRLLDGQGYKPESVAVREPTLDDVFLRLTGRRAEEAAHEATDGSSDEASPVASTAGGAP